MSELASAFVVFNSPYDDAATETARQQARDGVPPVEVSFQPGESIVTHGRVIAAIEVEALQEYGLIGSSGRWEDLGGAAILALLVISFLVLYISRNVSLYRDLRKLTVIAILFLVFLYSAWLNHSGSHDFAVSLSVDGIQPAGGGFVRRRVGLDHGAAPGDPGVQRSAELTGSHPLLCSEQFLWSANDTAGSTDHVIPLGRFWPLLSRAPPW